MTLPADEPERLRLPIPEAIPVPAHEVSHAFVAPVGALPPEAEQAQEPVRRGREGVGWPLALLALTTASVFAAGWLMSAVLVSEGKMGSAWAGALLYTLGLMGILIAHEMGHKSVMIARGIDASWPYFIPFPISILGTMGAVIRVRRPIESREAAVEMAAAGPIAGFLVAIPVCWIGLALSWVEPLPEAFDGIVFGEPLAFRALSLALRDIPPGHELFIHPLCFAGWAGLLVTALNLLPMGQLDGGHILRAVVGERVFKPVALAVALGLVLCAFATGSFGWLLWAAIGSALTFVPYPAPKDGDRPLSLRARALALASLVVLVLSFTPAPIGLTAAGAAAAAEEPAPAAPGEAPDDGVGD